MPHHRGFRLGCLAGWLVATGLALPVPAAAAKFTATEIGYDNALLSNFNLVTLANLGATQTATTDGRVLVGGNLSITSGKTYGACSSSTGCVGNLSANVDPTGGDYGALTVFGNVAGTGATLRAGYSVSAANRTANGNTAYISGSAAVTFQANGTSSTTGSDLKVAGAVSALTVNVGRATTTSTGNTLASGQKTGSQTNATYAAASAASVFPFSSSALISQINHLAQGIANLPGTPQALPPSTTGLFTANADFTSNGKTYGLITTTMANLAGQTNFTGINNNGNAATFVVVTGDGANYTLPNLGSYADANKVIFEFVDATTLKFAGAWNGSILAPLATVTTMGGAISGTVIVNALTQSQAITSANLFAGDLSGLIPEPASVTLFGLGAAAAALMRRRQRRPLSAPG